MNKQKGIIIGILALAVTMMVGYALFSETITINGTATAKGSFDIDFDCELMTESLDLGGGLTVTGTEGGTGTCTIEGDTITTTSTINKPTDRVSYKITLTNNGTIPAVLKTVDSCNNVSEDGTSSGDYGYIDKATYLAGQYGLYKDNDLIFGDSFVENENIILQPKETIILFISNLWMDSHALDVAQPKLQEAGATMNYNVTLGFEQSTN